MSDYSKLESQLNALTPRPLSEDGRKMLHETIDSLAADQVEAIAPSTISFSRYRTYFLGGGAAAAAIALASVLAFNNSAPEEAMPSTAGFVPLEEAVSTEEIAENSVGPEGFITEGGWPVRKVRYRVIKEATVQDEASGVVMTIIDPVDEVVEGVQKSF